MEATHGFVYVLEKQLKSEGSETVQPKLLESVLFSDLNHKWYDQNGKLSQLFEKYKDSQYSLGFKLIHEDEHHNQVEFEGKLLVPFKLGQLGQLDFESVPEADKEGLQFLKRHGMISKDNGSDTGLQIVKNLKASTMIASMCPDMKLRDMKLLQISVETFFILDDIMDKASVQSNLTFKQSQRFWSTIIDILDGKTVEYKKCEAEEINSSQLPEVYLSFLSVMKAFRSETCRNGEEDGTHVIEAYKEYCHAVCLESCQQWKRKETEAHSLLFQPAQQELRLLTCGSKTTIEMILFDGGIRVEGAIRDSFLFKYFVKNFQETTSRLNDLMSFKKELKGGGSCNAVWLLHKKDGLSINDALKTVVGEINRFTQILCETGELLEEMYDGDEQLSKVVKAVKGVVCGNMQWHGLTDRYDHDIIYNCLVELE